MVATEISLILNPSITLLISSVQTKNELRTIFRWFGKTKLIKIIPTFLFDPPRLIAKYLFGAYNNELLNTILDNTDLGFVKWALNELICWKNEVPIQPLLQINGSNDKLILPKGETPIELIDGGGHFMIVDRANEVSAIINDRLKGITPRYKKL